jgi:hypothetical protein
VRWPRRHFTVVVLTNRDAPEPYALALQIARLYLPDADGTARRRQRHGTRSEPAAAAGAQAVMARPVAQGRRFVRLLGD